MQEPLSISVRAIGQTLRIPAKVLHIADAKLERRGNIERTHVPHARRAGQRRDNIIVNLAGVRLNFRSGFRPAT